MVTAVVGSGGKTTLIHKLAKQYTEKGQKVFVTTSTHMYTEQDTLLSDNADEIIAVLERDGYVMAGVTEPKDERKIKSLSKETYEKVCRRADMVLIEADGSKNMPIKFPGETEPVIYDNVEEIIVVCGLQAIGKTLAETAFRLEKVTQCLGTGADTIVTAQHIRTLVTEGYLKPLAEKYPGKKISVYPVCDGTPCQKTAFSLIKDTVNAVLFVLPEE